eukprot:1159392-Pelagomonas_calceolata.AAC.1
MPAYCSDDGLGDECLSLAPQWKQSSWQHMFPSKFGCSAPITRHQPPPSATRATKLSRNRPICPAQQPSDVVTGIPQKLYPWNSVQQDGLSSGRVVAAPPAAPAYSAQSLVARDSIGSPPAGHPLQVGRASCAYWKQRIKEGVAAEAPQNPTAEELEQEWRELRRRREEQVDLGDISHPSNGTNRLDMQNRGAGRNTCRNE